MIMIIVSFLFLGQLPTVGDDLTPETPDIAWRAPEVGYDSTRRRRQDP